jgi:hypothetical protein
MTVMTGMTDAAFENFFPAQLLEYQNDGIQYSSDLWAGVPPFVGSRLSAQPTSVHAEWSDDIEHIYTELHQSVDRVISKIPLYTAVRLDQLREQNRKLIAKLKSLDSAFTTPATVVNDRGFLVCSSAGSESASVASSPSASSAVGNFSIPETREIWQAVPDTLIQDASAESIVQQTPSTWPRRPSFAAAKHGSKLAKKLLQVGNQEARIQIAEFAKQLQLPIELPKISHFPSASKMTDGPHFLQLVINLGLAIESSIFVEQNSRIRKRIAMAHFYHAYTIAQENPEVFLSWCDSQQLKGCSMLPKGGSKSVVQHRFADLIFSRDVQLGGTPAPRPSDNGDDAKRRAAKIQTWRKSGKKWAQFIQRFGYGILLLLPPCLSDEE